jgi:thioesterase domain-containing protein
VEMHSVPGTHYTLMTQPNVQTLAALMNEQLIRGDR